MREEVFIIILAMIMILGAMAVAAVILLSGNNNRQEPQSPAGAQWHVELWNIYYGYKVDLRFVNTFVLGRISLFDRIVGSVPTMTDNTISREHCMFYDQDGQLLVWNMSAVNPASINGYRLNAPRQIVPGDRLELGNSVFLITIVERM